MHSYPLARRHRGFTLLEIMVVLVIIGLMAAMIAPSVMSRLDEGKITTARSDVAALMQALKLYKLDNQRYPTPDQGLDALINKPANASSSWKPYLDKLPNDPWKHPYQYANPGIKGEIDVYSLGQDGQPGGEGIDADIGSWQ